MLDIISVLLNLLRIFCALVYDLSWRIFHVCLKRMCILYVLSVMFYKYLLSPASLMCYRRPLFCCRFSVRMICPLMSAGYESPLLLLSCCQFLSLCPLMFAIYFKSSSVRCVLMDEIIIFLYWSIYHYMIPFIFC